MKIEDLREIVKRYSDRHFEIASEWDPSKESTAEKRFHMQAQRDARQAGLAEGVYQVLLHCLDTAIRDEDRKYAEEQTLTANDLWEDAF